MAASSSAVATRRPLRTFLMVFLWNWLRHTFSMERKTTTFSSDSRRRSRSDITSNLRDRTGTPLTETTRSFTCTVVVVAAAVPPSGRASRSAGTRETLHPVGRPDAVVTASSPSLMGPGGKRIAYSDGPSDRGDEDVAESIRRAADDDGVAGAGAGAEGRGDRLEKTDGAAGERAAPDADARSAYDGERTSTGLPENLSCCDGYPDPAASDAAIPAGFFLLSADSAAVSGLSHALFLGLATPETAALLPLAPLSLATEGELNRSARFVPTLRALAGRPAAATVSSHLTPPSAPRGVLLASPGVASPPVPAGVRPSV